MMNELHHNRLGEWWFRCRRCKVEGLPHYSRHSALADQAAHRCSMDPRGGGVVLVNGLHEPASS